MNTMNKTDGTDYKSVSARTTVSRAGKRFFARMLWVIFALCFLSFASQKMQAQTTATFNIQDEIWSSGSDIGNGCIWDGTVLTVNNGANIEITGTVTSGRRIVIASGATANVTLNDVSITGFTYGSDPYEDVCPLWLHLRLHQ